MGYCRKQNPFHAKHRDFVSGLVSPQRVALFLRAPLNAGSKIQLAVPSIHPDAHPLAKKL